MKIILTFGSIHIDLVYSVKELPLKGQTVVSKKFETFFGGKGANQAVAIRRMGTDLTMIGKVGDDANGDKTIENLITNQINVDLISKVKGVATGVGWVVVDEHANNIIITDLGADKEFKAQEVQNYLKEIEKSDLVLTQLETTREFTFEFLKQAKKLGKTTILNPGPAIKLTPEEIKSCDFIIPNETEIAIVLGEEVSDDFETIKNQAIRLQKISNKHVIVTLGENGSLYVGPDTIKKFNAVKVNAIDPTAAGDTFIGAFAHMLAHEKSIQEAIEFATYASALTVTKSGAQSSIPTLELVNMFIQSYNKI
ncbi:ribokinase [Williamsoniiplasma luminosum]|uniref:Ribokinase n=1 Tax=Williamsoniiplasma luminosum TaxID=214888 RepID=A0A2K8NTN6_9MOLU|nr:ribokinase [Williamsoniiplasma luminosum]ATZ17127.1 ribokinase [Williamsoniiplasma luminosum]